MSDLYNKIVAVANMFRGDLADKADTDVLAPEFDPSFRYPAGYLVLYEGQTYRSISEHIGSWGAGGDFTPSTVGAAINLKPREYVQHTVDTSTYALMDRASNTLTLTGTGSEPSSIALSAPAALAAPAVREFSLSVTVPQDYTPPSISIATVSLIDAKGGVATLAVESGKTTTYFFSETSSGVFVVTGANDTGGGGSGISVVDITWMELVGLRTQEGLVPGGLYRITDYVATSADRDTSLPFASATMFHIIVRALSTAQLDEDAVAVSSGSNLYAGPPISVRYCLDNDTGRFGWADSSSGKGVIYWMRDAQGNEAPYDFKGISSTDGMFLQHLSYNQGTGTYDNDYAGSVTPSGCYGNTLAPAYSGGVQVLNHVVLKYGMVQNPGCVGNVFGLDCREVTVADIRYCRFGAGCANIYFGDGNPYNPAAITLAAGYSSICIEEGNALLCLSPAVGPGVAGAARANVTVERGTSLASEPEVLYRSTSGGDPTVYRRAGAVVVEVGSGPSYTKEADGTVSTEGTLNADGTFDVEGTLNADGTFDVTV